MTFQRVRSAIKATNSNISLSTDVGTSEATEAYLGITCHDIRGVWNMESICPTTMPLEDCNKTSNIAEWLEEVAARFKIPPSKFKVIVHYNGASLLAAANILKQKYGWAYVCCTGCTFQLATNSTLKNSSTEKAIGLSKSDTCAGL